MVGHNYQTPSFNWHNLVNMQFNCIKMLDNVAKKLLNLQALKYFSFD